MEKICKECGKEFSADNSKRLFCSRSCSATHNNIGVRRHGSSPENTNCLCCGEPINRQISSQKYCSKKCQQLYLYKQYIDRWKSGIEDGISGKKETSAYIRRYMFEKYNSKCAECGWDKVNQYTGNIPLQLEHIDGNWKNNKEENLTLLCPSCHSLTPTYGNLNRGNGRENRYKSH